MALLVLEFVGRIVRSHDDCTGIDVRSKNYFTPRSILASKIFLRKVVCWSIMSFKSCSDCRWKHVMGIRLWCNHWLNCSERQNQYISINIFIGTKSKMPYTKSTRQITKVNKFIIVIGKYKNDRTQSSRRKKHRYEKHNELRKIAVTNYLTHYLKISNNHW